MRVLKKLLVVLVVAVALFAIVGLLLPRRVHVERSTVIDAPRATVFTLVNGYRTFNKWNPWYDLDPKAQYELAGPESGVGAKISWTGDPDKVGSGSQEIIESRPDEVVRMHLDFGAQGIATAQFTLAPEGEGTKVTWGLDTDLGLNPIARWFGLMFDRMIGPDYERGLAGLKTLAESLPKDDFSGLQVEQVTAEPVLVAYVSSRSDRDAGAIGRALGAAYAQVRKFLAARRLKRAGAPLTIDTKWGDEGYEFDAAIPIDRAPDGGIPEGSPVQVKETYAGRALKVVHHGAYRTMDRTYARLLAYVAAHGYEPVAAPWDEYVSDPGATPEADLITNVYMPIRE